jgi:phosphate transport system substrate-binding protein
MAKPSCQLEGCMTTFSTILKVLFLVVLAFILVVIGSVVWHDYQWQKNLIDTSLGQEVLSEEVNLDQYKPFSKNNLLAQVLPESNIKFTTKDAPSLDGATAAYPVYAAAAQALYTPDAALETVKVSKTSEAYERLIKGEVDIIFVAQASKAHQKLAADKNIKLNLTPIGKEAFVFMVSQQNPLKNLTAPQIRDIYSGRVKQWSKVGGSSEDIMAFQRPENSGSQTVMLAKVMQNEKMRAPLQEEKVQGMGGAVKRVAAYRNASQSIGYSFRYYATRMQNTTAIKLLAVDGIAPTAENIRNGTYPFTVDVFMVTAGEPKPATRKLMDWMLSKPGQKLIEDTGYVPLR